MFGNKSFIIKLKYPVSHYLICWKKNYYRGELNDLFQLLYLRSAHPVSCKFKWSFIFLSVVQLLNTFNFSLSFFILHLLLLLFFSLNKKKLYCKFLFNCRSFCMYFSVFFFGNNRNENESTSNSFLYINFGFHT